MTAQTARSLVSLPRLTASSALALVNTMLAVAREEEAAWIHRGQALPVAITRAHLRLETAGAELAHALQPYLPTCDPQAARCADAVLDQAWSGLHDFLVAWTKVPRPFNPAPEGVAELQRLLFADGMDFVELDYQSQWQQSQARIDALAASPYQDTLIRLGGSPFLASLRHAHAAYGQALGLTAMTKDDALPLVREKRDAALAALRNYVTRVLAWGDPEEPGSEAAARGLLEPLARWGTSAAGACAVPACAVRRGAAASAA